MEIIGLCPNVPLQMISVQATCRVIRLVTRNASDLDIQNVQDKLHVKAS